MDREEKIGARNLPMDDLIGGAYVLAVDDFSSIRRIIVNTLRSRNAFVDEASNGAYALDKMRMALENDAPYDMVYVDIEMPIMDGIQFLQQVRGDPKLKETPVIVISSHSDSQEIRDCISLGITDYIIKPVTKERLHQSATKAISIRRNQGLLAHARDPQASAEDAEKQAAKEYSRQIFKRLESIEKLPVLPVVLDRIKQLASDPNSNNERIADIMKDEPSLMANVFKLANSAMYGSRDPIDSLQAAITRLGLNAVNNLATSMAVVSVLSQNDSTGFNHKEFCRHSISTGIAMCVLYELCRQKMSTTYTKDLLHLAGLLHDIGKIIIIQFFQKEYLEALEYTKTQAVPLFVAEQKALGVDHSDVGMWLGKKWNLSSLQLSTIRYHHAPFQQEAEHQDLVLLCHCANYICNLQKIGDGGDTMTPLFDQRAFDKLGISVNDIPAIIQRVNAESKNSEILMSFVK
ncbi:MAG: response regulator [Lentisphaerota bacterium]